MESKLIRNFLFKTLWKILPIFILQPFLFVIFYLSQNLDISIPFLGVPKRAFGNGIMINFGKNSFENAFIPIPMYSQSIITCVVNKMKKIPRIE